jgi:hypothetical protein
LSKSDLKFSSMLSCVHFKCETEKQLLVQIIAESLRLLGRLDAPLCSFHLTAFCEPFLVFQEMLQMGALHGDSLELSAELQSVFLVSATPQVLFLSRMFSVLECSSLDENEWNGVVDVDLAAFGCGIKAVWDTVRDLFDVVALRCWLDNLVGEDVSSLSVSSISELLPFVCPPCLAVGLLMKRLLSDPLSFTVQIAHIDFPNILNPKKEVLIAAEFLEFVFANTKAKTTHFLEAYKYFTAIKKLSVFFV